MRPTLHNSTWYFYAASQEGTNDTGTDDRSDNIYGIHNDGTASSSQGPVRGRLGRIHHESTRFAQGRIAQTPPSSQASQHGSEGAAGCWNRPRGHRCTRCGNRLGSTDCALAHGKPLDVVVKGRFAADRPFVENLQTFLDPLVEQE